MREEKRREESEKEGMSITSRQHVLPSSSSFFFFFSFSGFFTYIYIYIYKLRCYCLIARLFSIQFSLPIYTAARPLTDKKKEPSGLSTFSLPLRARLRERNATHLCIFFSSSSSSLLFVLGLLYIQNCVCVIAVLCCARARRSSHKPRRQRLSHQADRNPYRERERESFFL